MTGIAASLAEWAYRYRPDDNDLALAQRSLVDTVAVALAARSHPVTDAASTLTEPGRWAVAAHVLDFDDLHLPSTTHISAVCVPATIAAVGDARAFLAGAGVMARLGTALGWPHYSSGWHATCTAGAPGAAAAAAVALGLEPARIAVAIALAIPAAGGVQRAFGTDAKSLQVGFAVEAGVRAARLAAAGADADPAAVEQWFALVRGQSPATDFPATPAIPGGLAIKLHPACYASQRPIAAVRRLHAAATDLESSRVTRLEVRTPEAAVAPLLHHSPLTGLQGKFSLEYALAAALLDSRPGFDSFTDAAVRRPAAGQLMRRVHVELVPGGAGLLDGELELTVHTEGGPPLHAAVDFPPGSPQRPPSDEELAAKVADCLGDFAAGPRSWTWQSVATLLRAALPPTAVVDVEAEPG